jgi:hypothetical protein
VQSAPRVEDALYAVPRKTLSNCVHRTADLIRRYVSFSSAFDPSQMLIARPCPTFEAYIALRVRSLFGTAHTRASRRSKVLGVTCRNLFRLGDRAVVAASQVDRYLTKQLRKMPGFGWVTVFERRTKKRCNGSGAVVPVGGFHAPEASVIAAALSPFVKAARARFDLKE